jgi:uncharacterized integral membrane protein
VNTGSPHPSSWREGLRRLRRYLFVLVGLLLAVAAWIFALENRGPVAVRFTRWIVRLPLALALLSAFFLGVLLALLAVVPRWWAWRLRYHLLHRQHLRLSREGDEPPRNETS